MKKKHVALLLSVCALGMTAAFSGCAKEESPFPDAVYLDAVIHDILGNEYTINLGTELRLEMQQTEEQQFIWFWAEMYDRKTGELYTKEPLYSFIDFHVDLNMPGTYEIKQYYESIPGRGSVTYKIILTVTPLPDPRPEPDIVLLPGDDCVEYVQNERYVYKYDGEYHRPRRWQITYEGQTVTTLYTWYNIPIYDVKTLERTESQERLCDIGVYEGWIILDPSDYTGEFKGMFKETRIRIIIEIIE